MNQKELRAALHAGKRVYGTVIVSDSPRWPDYVARIGVDFVFIDTEHISLDRKQMSWMCLTYKAMGIAPIVRIPSPDPYAATMALDAGAEGIIAPYIETADQVRALHGAVKLRPIKGAKLDSVLNGNARFGPKLAAYQKKNHGDNLLIINVESLPAIANLDEILAVEGLDAVLMGPHDLSSSVGVPEEYDAPEFEAAVLEIIRRARARGIAAGIHSWMGVEREISWARAGLNLIIHSADIIAMEETLTREFRTLRETLDGPAKARQPLAASASI